MKVSASLENYLEVIYEIADTDGKVRVTDLAQKMGVSKPSVNKAISNLKDLGLILHEKYGSLELTEKGEVIAKDITNRHGIIKSFLRDVLNVSEEIADTEACSIEHCLSEDTIIKLEKFLIDRN